MNDMAGKWLADCYIQHLRSGIQNCFNTSSLRISQVITYEKIHKKYLIINARYMIQSYDDRMLCMKYSHGLQHGKGTTYKLL